MNSVFQLIEVTPRNDHMFKEESTSFGEMLIAIGEYVRDGKSPHDFYIKETRTDALTGEITHRHISLAFKFN